MRGMDLELKMTSFSTACLLRGSLFKSKGCLEKFGEEVQRSQQPVGGVVRRGGGVGESDITGGVISRHEKGM